jgi:hypothetical protein
MKEALQNDIRVLEDELVEMAMKNYIKKLFVNDENNKNTLTRDLIESRLNDFALSGKEDELRKLYSVKDFYRLLAQNTNTIEKYNKDK